MVDGSCLCGAIAYRVTGEFSPITQCYCGQCRKASGSAFGANASVASADFAFLRGESLLGEFESSPGQLRCFCTRCGSPLIKRFRDKPELLRLRLGSLDGDPKSQLVAHIFVDAKAPWTVIADDLPQHPG